MKKVKFMLLSLALVAVVGGALAFKARYQQTFCTTFAQLDAPNHYTCIINDAAITCPTILVKSITANPDPLPAVPVCTAPLVDGTCGDQAAPVPCDAPTVTIRKD